MKLSITADFGSRQLVSLPYVMQFGIDGSSMLGFIEKTAILVPRWS